MIVAAATLGSKATEERWGADHWHYYGYPSVPAKSSTLYGRRRHRHRSRGGNHRRAWA